MKTNLEKLERIQLISPEQLAQLLQVSQRTLRRMISAGKIITPKRVGRQLRWPLGEVQKWIEQGCPSPAGKR